MMKIFNKKTNKGFSIAEVVISVFVITVGLLAIIKLITGSMTYSILSRDQIIASQLAQEGIELVRNVRDNNAFNSESRTWMDSLGNNANACVEYDMNTQHPVDFTCSTNQLFYDPATYTYSHDNGDEATRFYRQLVIQEVDNYDPDASPPYDDPDAIPPYDVSDDIIDEVAVTSYVWWGGDPSVPFPCNSAEKCVLTEDSILPYE